MQLNIAVPAYEQLRDLLREEIISGKLQPCVRLTIAEVAKRFGLSHMPVREAFQSLQGEGLVEITPHKGCRVLSLDIKYVKNVYEIREMIEGLLARLSAMYIKPEKLAQLTRLHNKVYEAYQEKDLKKWIKADRDFHYNIFVISDNAEALKIYTRYYSLLISLRSEFGVSQKRWKIVNEEHSAILKALKEKDQNLAELISRQHSVGAKKDMLKMLKNGAFSQKVA
jgi:DNA-binding GntR family transcriptional regulator